MPSFAFSTVKEKWCSPAFSSLPQLCCSSSQWPQVGTFVRMISLFTILSLNVFICVLRTYNISACFVLVLSPLTLFPCFFARMCSLYVLSLSTKVSFGCFPIYRLSTFRIPNNKYSVIEAVNITTNTLHETTFNILDSRYERQEHILDMCLIP